MGTQGLVLAFLSLLDDRAKPRGSRDPLGFELVWTHYGRQVIGNLTTVTSSLNNFAVALLGFKWANELCAHLPDGERQAQLRETFLRFEQLTGYLRYLANDTKLMGITRVAKRMQDPSISISLGMHAAQTILSDQASYGMWGLYSSAMRDTGLVRGEERSLTPLGEQIAVRMESRLDKQALLDLLRKGGKLKPAALEVHAKPFLATIQNRSTQASLVESLMGGNERNLVQQELWQLTRKMRISGERWIDVADFIYNIGSKTKNAELKSRLIEVEHIERLLVATNNLFHYCRRKDGESLRDIVGALKAKNYNYSHISTTQSLAKLPHSHLLETIRTTLLAGDNQKALIAIFELNKRVMEQRGGAPWVELEPNQCLRVRMPSETSELLAQEQLIRGWDYEYFFTSYLSIANQAPVS
jgi:hypothetical protein